MAIPAGYLGTLFGTAQSSDASYLRALYGYDRATARSSGLTPVQALRSAETNRARDMQRTAAQPDVKRAIDAFTASVGKAQSVEALLKNPAVMEVLLTANGLGDKVSAPALARKALMSDLNNPGSLANTLSDTRWKAVAKTYDFAGKGLAVIRDPAVMAKLTDAYAEVKWRHSLDQSTPGLSNALTFRAQASGIGSALQVLGDPVLREVVSTALGLPKQIAFQSLEAQETAISSRLDVTKFQDPRFVDKFTQRYLLAAANTASSLGGDLATLTSKASGLVI